MSRNAVCALLLPLLCIPACKGDKKSSEAAGKPNNGTQEKKTEEAPAEATAPVVVDAKAVDLVLEGLADATVKSGLPALKGDLGIACGDDPQVIAALAHIGIAAGGAEQAELKAGKSFHFADLCVGWRPFVEPPPEMYWMISAGAPADGETTLPLRRCVRVSRGEAGVAKLPIADGPCLTIHSHE